MGRARDRGWLLTLVAFVLGACSGSRTLSHSTTAGGNDASAAPPAVGAGGLDVASGGSTAGGPVLNTSGSSLVEGGGGAGGSLHATAGTGGAEQSIAGAGGASRLGLALPFRSGSRLKARYWDGGGGARWFTHFYDTKLEIDCSFHLAADGEVRCLPVVDAQRRTKDDEYFSNASCTELTLPLFRPAKYHLLDPDFCPGPGAPERPNAVVQLGELQAPQPVYELTYLNECVESPARGLPRIVDIPAATFVRATAMPPANPTASLHALQFLGEDGSYEAPAFLDAVRGERCFRANEGKDYELPTVCMSERLVHAEVSYFRDPECMRPVVASSSADCKYPSVTTIYEPAPCKYSGWTKGLYDVGVVYQEARKQYVRTYCSQVTDLQGPVYERSARVPWEALPQLDTVEVGEGRLKVRFGTTQDGVPVHGRADAARHDEVHPTFFDTELGVACEAIRSWDGAPSRCIPLEAALLARLGEFSDPECTKPATTVFATLADESCSTQPPAYYLVGDYGHGEARIYRRGKPEPGTIYRKGVSCTGSSDPNWFVAPLTELSTTLATVVEASD